MVMGISIIDTVSSDVMHNIILMAILLLGCACISFSQDVQLHYTHAVKHALQVQLK